MKNPPESAQDEYLIHRGTRQKDPAREQIIRLDPEHPLIRLLNVILPVGGTTYIAPKGQLTASIALDGRPLPVRIRGREEDITLYPKLRIIGLASHRDPVESATRLCAVLHPHYEEQIAALRAKMHPFFVDDLGLACTEEHLDGITDHQGSRATFIRDRARDELGLEIEWMLGSDPDVQQWIHRLQAQLPAVSTLVFNSGSDLNQFKLSFTCKVLSAIPSRRHLARQRARAGLTPETEIQKILEQVRAILDPGFGQFSGGIQVWAFPNFGKLLRSAFEQKVCPEIEATFGYHVAFSNFHRLPTGVETKIAQTIESTDYVLRDFQSADTYLEELRQNLREARANAGFDPESPLVKRLELQVSNALAERDAAREQMERASRGHDLQLASGNDPRVKAAMKYFHDFFELNRPDLLQLEAASSSSAPDAKTP